MKSFDIWSEGYRCAGESGRATFHGTSTGKSFREACKNFASQDDEFKQYFDEKDLTYWGCRLFDNQISAIKSFG